MAVRASSSVSINAEDYHKFFEATKEMSGKIRTRTRKRVRDVATKYGPGIVQEGSEGLPRRGGLAEHVASKGRSPTVALSATGARLVLGKKKGPQIGRMNKGQLRHPVFWVYWKKGARQGSSKLQRAAHALTSKAILSDPRDRSTWKWVPQEIAGGSFTTAVEKVLPALRTEIAAEVTAVLKELG